jgi:uncharacterized membrane protein
MTLTPRIIIFIFMTFICYLAGIFSSTIFMQDPEEKPNIFKMICSVFTPYIIITLGYAIIYQLVFCF